MLMPFIFSQTQLNNQYNELIQYIKKTAPKKNPRDTMVIADGYSFIGYHIWNRVLKYEWANQNDSLNDILKNDHYLYFVVNKETKDRDFLLKKADELNLQQKVFGENILIHR